MFETAKRLIFLQKFRAIVPFVSTPLNGIFSPISSPCGALILYLN